MAASGRISRQTYRKRNRRPGADRRHMDLIIIRVPIEYGAAVGDPDAYAENPSEISRSSWLKSATIQHPQIYGDGNRTRRLRWRRWLDPRVIGLCHGLVIDKARYQQEDIQCQANVQHSTFVYPLVSRPSRTSVSNSRPRRNPAAGKW